MIGKTISHYRILAKLGAGGMGTVYKAQDTTLERVVAIKFLPHHIAANPEQRERFKIEAKAAAALNHPNIATIHAIEEVDDEMFIVMEFIDGRELKKQVASGKLQVETIIDIATQIAEGLKAAHAKGITHGDIKSSNIMVTDSGQIKIMDFGLAKIGGDVHLTRAGTTLGTAAYMSPEQARGEQVDHRTDIWSLGVVMYEMITGQLPFKGVYEQAVLYSILNEDFEPIASLRRDLPEELKRVVDKALAKNRNERYQLIDDVLTDLRAMRGEKHTGMKPVPTILPFERHTVGREKERAELRTALQAAASGRSLLLCVAGEPGIGKTTLVEEFLDEVRVAGPPCTIARGRCSERLAGTEAYLPFLEVLESLLKSRADESVTKMMRELAPWWYAQIASLATDDSADARLMEEVRKATQERTKRELAGFLQEASRRGPLVLFFDDLHWSDVSTIDLLTYLASKFDVMRLLIVATYRPAELLLAKHPFFQIKPDLQARGVCREIELGFLTRPEIERYLGLEYPEHNFPADFPKLIHLKTEGSPLFMVDLVRYLRDRGQIVEKEGRWSLSQSLADIQLELPESVRGMIQRKIDYLSESDRRMLVAASVQGYEFDSAVLGSVLAMDEEEIEERLQALDRVHRFVQLIDEAEFPDGTLTLRYRFVHVLYQNELYASLTRTKQARLSQAVAKGLLQYYGERSSSVASELAVLFESARDNAHAVEYFLLAAQNASRVFAYQEAIALARRGLKLLKPLPDTPDRTQQELNLLSVLGPALTATRGYGVLEVEQSYTRMRELCQKVGETLQLFPALYGLYGFCLLRAELQRTREIAEQFLQVAQSQQDSNPLPMAYRVLGWALFFLGEITSGRDYLEQAIATYDPQTHRSHLLLYGRDTGTDALLNSALILWVLGHPDKAKQRQHEGLAFARELDHPHAQAVAFCLAALLHQCRRQERLTKELAEETMALSIEQGFPLWLAAGTIMRGWALSRQGQEEEGIAQMIQGLNAWQATETKLLLPYLLSMLAEEYGKAGQTEEGLSKMAEALAAVRNTGERWCEAELYRLKGELMMMQGEAESEVESCFHQALDTARRHSAKSFELRAAISLCRLWHKQGKQEEARKILNEIYSWFTEGFDTADLQEAKALLDELA